MAIDLCNRIDSNNYCKTYGKIRPQSNRKTGMILAPVVKVDSKEELEKFLSKFDTFLYDCDRVLSEDIDSNNNTEVVVCKAIQLIQNLRKRDKNIIFTTNKSNITREQMLMKLNRVGFEAKIDELFPTSYTTAVYLKAINFDRKVFVVGSDAIAQELGKVGIRSTVMNLHSAPKPMKPGYASFKLDPFVGAVVIGFDDNISFASLVRACTYATKPDCMLIVANEDIPDSTQSDLVNAPEAGVAAIRVACNKGFISLAKPHKFYFKCIRRMHSNIDSNKTICIADSLTTDTDLAKNNGIKTLLLKPKECSDEDLFPMFNSGRTDYFISLLTF